MTTKFEIEHITDPYIHYSKKALVPPFEFALVKYLNGDDGRILDGAVQQRRFVSTLHRAAQTMRRPENTHISKLSFQ